MSASRMDMHRLQEFVRLHRLGAGSREIARVLKMSRNTQRLYAKHLAKALLLDGEPDQLPEMEVLRAAVEQQRPPAAPPQETTSLVPWRDPISAMAARGAGPKAIYDALRLEHEDFPGSLSAVKRLCLRLARDRGVQAEDVVIPVATGPGEVGQVDFGYAGRLYDPETRTNRRAWIFVMVLGYSRHMFAAIVFDQSAETWQQLHIEAFAALGGVVATVVPDNLKAAVIRSGFAVDEPTNLHRSYRELARHYGFTVDPTPVRAPQKKGKVESAVKYIRRNFLAPRQFTDIHEARRELTRWVAEVAAKRTHGTTGRKPGEVFEAEERGHLRPLPERPYELVVWKQAQVHRDAHVMFDRRLYSVPWLLLGKQVWVRATAGTVALYHDDKRVATHDRRGPGMRSTVEAHLPTHRADYRHRCPEHWLERADNLGPEVGSYVREIFASDAVLSKLRVAQSVVRQLEAVPPERARAACARAGHFGAYNAGAVKKILDRGLDADLAPEIAVPPPTAPRPRYARDFSDLAVRFGGQA